MSTFTDRPHRNRGPLSGDHILKPSSPIVSKDIHGFLLNCISEWDISYGEDDKRQIIDLLPPAYRIYDLDPAGKLTCPLSLEFVQRDPYLKAAVSKFKKDVEEGYYEKFWQNKARRAMQERRDGKFDDYLRENAEAMFGDRPQDSRDVYERDEGSDWERENGSKRRGKKRRAAEAESGPGSREED